MSSAAARHILVSTKEEAEDIKKKIEEGADFAEMARRYSQCPSGQEGGDLGTFSPGQMVKEFDEVVFSGEVGKVLGPVKTQFGYHLIEITDRTELPGCQSSFTAEDTRTSEENEPCDDSTG